MPNSQHYFVHRFQICQFGSVVAARDAYQLFSVINQYVLVRSTRSRVFLFHQLKNNFSQERALIAEKLSLFCTHYFAVVCHSEKSSLSRYFALKGSRDISYVTVLELNLLCFCFILLKQPHVLYLNFYTFCMT